MKTASVETTPKTRTTDKQRRRAGRNKTKKSILVEMLSRKSGADLAAMSSKLEWQPHTTRAALSGLRKAGYQLSAETARNGKATRYRITAGPVE